jgi:hypothetical protein
MGSTSSHLAHESTANWTETSFDGARNSLKTDQLKIVFAEI